MSGGVPARFAVKVAYRKPEAGLEPRLRHNHHGRWYLCDKQGKCWYCGQVVKSEGGLEPIAKRGAVDAG